MKSNYSVGWHSPTMAAGISFRPQRVKCRPAIILINLSPWESLQRKWCGKFYTTFVKPISLVSHKVFKCVWAPRGTSVSNHFKIPLLYALDECLLYFNRCNIYGAQSHIGTIWRLQSVQLQLHGWSGSGLLLNFKLICLHRRQILKSLDWRTNHWQVTPGNRTGSSHLSVYWPNKTTVRGLRMIIL